MKELKIEFRKAIAVWMLRKALGVLPVSDFKTKYAKFLNDNIINL